MNRQIKTISIEDLKNKNIIIYGNGSFGTVTYKILSQYNIKVYAFANSNVIENEYLGLPVISPNEIKKVSNYLVLLASLNYIEQMISTLEAEDVNEYYSISEILTHINEIPVLTDADIERSVNVWRYDVKVKSLNDNVFVWSNIDLVVSDICNLKCNNCNSLIPHYKSPQHIDASYIIKCFDRFLSAIDVLLELRILGGEPFLYPELDKLIRYYSENKKVLHIKIYTNSTIIPNDNVIQNLKNNKIIVHLSNYGSVSKKIDELTKIFKANNINYYRHDYLQWVDIGGLENRNYSNEKLKEVFALCTDKNCPSFYRGKLYVCPRAAHGEFLGYFKNSKNEAVDFSEEKFDVIKIRNILKKFTDRDYFQVCRYCDGFNENSLKSAAGSQKRMRTD